MMLPAVVIGLGTTGRRTVEYLQTMLYARYKGNPQGLDKYLKLIVFDTIDSNKVEWLPIPESSIDYGPIVLDQPKDIYATLDRPQWCTQAAVQGRATVLSGAMQNRALGRSVLWLRNSVVVDKINKAVEDLQTELNQRAKFTGLLQNLGIQLGNNPKINFFIVGSLTGGTCSSAFLDVAHHICEQFAQQSFGLFYVPPKVQPIWEHNGQNYEGGLQCAWSGLGDILYQWDNKLDNSESPKKKSKWQSNPPLFRNIALMEPKLGNRDFPNIETMEKVGAFFLYLYTWEDFQQFLGTNVLPSFFTFGISGEYDPAFETAAFAAMTRIAECIDNVTTTKIQPGSLNTSKAEVFKRQLLNEIRQELKKKLHAEKPESKTDVAVAIQNISDDLRKNMKVAADKGTKEIDSVVIDAMCGKEEGGGQLYFVMDFLDKLTNGTTNGGRSGVLQEMADSYQSRARVLDQDASAVKHLDPSFGLFAWRIDNDRWDNLVEVLVLQKCEDVLRQILDHANGIKQKLLALKDELTNSKILVDNWGKVMSQDLYPAGVTAAYANREDTVDVAALTLLKRVGGVTGNPLTDPSGLWIERKTIEGIMSSEIKVVPIKVRDKLIKEAVKRVMKTMLDNLTPKNFGQISAVPDSSSYLEFRSDFNTDGIITRCNQPLSSDRQFGYNYLVNLAFYNLEYSHLSSSIALAEAIDLSGIVGQPDVLAKRKCTLYWNKVLTRIVELTSFVVCDYSDVEGQYVRTGIRAGFAEFRFSPPDRILIVQDEIEKDINHLDDTEFAFLGSTLKHEVDENGVDVTSIVNSLEHNKVFNEDKCKELLETWNLIEGGVYLW